jgi:hypothetical protein
MDEIQQYRLGLHKAALELSGSLPLWVRLPPICHKLGIHSVERVALSKARAVVVDMATSPTISLNSTAIGAGKGKAALTPSERFVVSHELAHVLLYRSGARKPCTPSEYWQMELLCDDFARRLLISDQAISDTHLRRRSSAIDLLEVSSSLAVAARTPWAVAAHRIADLVEGAIFFRIEPFPAGFRIVISTRANEEGTGWLGVPKQIKEGCELFGALKRLTSAEPVAHISPSAVVGIAGIKSCQDGAAMLAPDGIRIALRQSHLENNG